LGSWSASCRATCNSTTLIIVIIIIIRKLRVHKTPD
jgi:hypothetical protein